MQFSVAATILALASSVFAQTRAPSPNPNFDPITAPATQEEVTAGTKYTIKWTVPAAFADVKVNIILIGGEEQNTQVPYLNIVEGIANSLGEYAWDVPSDLGGKPWNGLIIEDVADPVNNYQFSNPFQLLKNPDAASSGSASTTTITTASGTATVILSSAAETSTEASSSAESSSAEVSTKVQTTAKHSSTLATVPTSAPTTTPTTSEAPASESSSPAQVTGANGAGQAQAGIFAVIGGLAVALML